MEIRIVGVNDSERVREKKEKAEANKVETRKGNMEEKEEKWKWAWNYQQTQAKKTDAGTMEEGVRENVVAVRKNEVSEAEI